VNDLTSLSLDHRASDTDGEPGEEMAATLDAR
jgi:hypothetical protein